MLWLLIPLMLGLMLISITQLPRAIVLSAIIEYRYFKRQPSYAKQLSTSLKTVLIATWLVLATITLSVEQPPPWSVFTLVLTASLLVGAVIDHTTGLLPFRNALIIAIGALLYTSSTSPEDTVIAVLTAVVGSSALMLMNWLSWRWRRLTLLGGGDIALLAALSLCLSGTEIALIIWAASLTGLIESRWRRRSMIHFGPHLAIAALCCWYLKVIL